MLSNPFKKVSAVVLSVAIVALSIPVSSFAAMPAQAKVQNQTQCTLDTSKYSDLNLHNPVPNQKTVNALRGLSLQFSTAAGAFKKNGDADHRENISGLLNAKAQERKNMLLELMRANPNEAWNSIILENRAATLRPFASHCIEQETTLEGELLVLHADYFKEGVGTIAYILKTTDGKEVRLHLSGDETENLVSGKKVQVHGYRLDNDMLVDRSNPANIKEIHSFSLSHIFANVAEAAGTDSLGPQNTAVILVNFSDSPTTATQSSASDAVFNTMNSYYQENSYNQMNVTGNTYGPYTLSLTSADACSNTLVAQAAITAADGDINFNDYSHIIFIGPFYACGWAGISTLGKSTISGTTDGSPQLSESWVSDSYVSAGIIGHEFGHGLGVDHSAFSNCGATTFSTTTSCQVVEYGDTSSIMGAGYADPHHMDAVHKDMLSWFNDSTAVVASTSGSYTLSPLEASSTTFKALKIPRSASDYLYAEYRQPVGYDATLTNSDFFAGALIHNTYFLKSMLVDPTPPTDANTSSLKLNQSVTDPLTGSTLTVTDVAPDHVTINVALGKSDFIAPMATMTSPASNDVLSGSVTLTADASDPSGIKKVDFYTNQGKLLGTATNAPYSVTVDTTHMQNGTVGFYAKATDLAGESYGLANNTGNSSPVYVTIDNPDFVPPTVMLLTPTASSTVTSPVLVSATATDDVGIYSVAFYKDNGTLPAGSRLAPPYSINMALATGTHTIYAVAKDYAGNAATTSPITITVVGNPTVSISSPTASSTVKGIVTITASTTNQNPNDPTDHVTFSVDGSIVGISSTTPYQINWDSSSYVSGSTHSIAAKLYTQAGVASATSSAVTVTIADTIAPTVTITSPLTNTKVTHGSTVTIAANASDNIGVSKVEFSVNNTLTCTDTTSPYTCNWTVPSARGVVYTLTAKAYDAAGNMATTTSVVTSK